MHRQDSTRSSWQQARLSNEPWPYHPLQNVVYYRYYGRDWGSEPAAIPCKHFNITSRSYRKVFYVSARNAPSCAYRRTMRSEEHTSELQSLMRISYAVFCLKKKKYHSTPSKPHRTNTTTTERT